MNHTDADQVLVAVGDEVPTAALDYAAEIAARAGCGVHLVHVVHPVAQGPETPLVDTFDLKQEGRRVLVAAAEHLQNSAPGLSVRDELQVGGVVARLVEAARTNTRSVVLEHHDRSGLWRAITRSVTSGVAAHTDVPVISVPSGWRPAKNRRPEVAVGLDVAERSHELLALAVAESRGRGAELRVVHTWSLPGLADDVLTAEMVNEWNERATAEIEEALSATGEDLTGLQVRVDVGRGRAADALVEASSTADLVIVGRHDPLVPIGSHVGPVARAVLREASGPVLLAHPRPAHPRGDRRHRAAVAGS